MALICRPCRRLPKRNFIMKLFKKNKCPNVFCKNWTFRKWWSIK